MAKGPVTLGIQINIKIRAVFRQKFIHMKAVIAQQPVCLVQAVLAQQRRSAGEHRQ